MFFLTQVMINKHVGILHSVAGVSLLLTASASRQVTPVNEACEVSEPCDTGTSLGLTSHCWVKVSELPLTSYVTLGKLLNFSQLQFSHLLNGPTVINSWTCEG